MQAKFDQTTKGRNTGKKSVRLLAGNIMHCADLTRPLLHNSSLHITTKKDQHDGRCVIQIPRVSPRPRICVRPAHCSLRTHIRDVFRQIASPDGLICALDCYTITPRRLWTQLVCRARNCSESRKDTTSSCRTVQCSSLRVQVTADA